MRACLACLERRHITNQVEGLLIHVVVVTFCEASQAGDRGVQLHVLSWAVGEELGNEWIYRNGFAKRIANAIN